MSKGQAATEFEWVAGGSGEHLRGHAEQELDANNFQFLREGYLNMIEEETDHLPHGVYTSLSPTAARVPGSSTAPRGAHAVLVRRTSDPTIKGSWRRRWCVLSQTADGVHLLYYKNEQSFTSCEPPLGVVLMDECRKLYTIPNHSKSNQVFAVAFPHRIIMFHPDKRSELEGWLEAFQRALNMKDSSTSSPLKGLPKQKALRKDYHGQPWPRGHEMSADKQKGGTKEELSANVAEVLSFRTLPDEIDGNKMPATKIPPPTAELKGLPKKKALHDHYYKSPEEKRLFEDIEEPRKKHSHEKGAVQFLGFKMLDT